MTMGTAFWVGMFFWLLFGLYWYWPRGGTPANFAPVGGNLLLFILLLLLGWAEFGAPIR